GHADVEPHARAAAQPAPQSPRPQRGDEAADAALPGLGAPLDGQLAHQTRRISTMVPRFVPRRRPRRYATRMATTPSAITTPLPASPTEVDVSLTVPAISCSFASMSARVTAPSPLRV